MVIRLISDPPLEEEQPQDHHDQEEPQDEGLRQVVDGQFDEVGLLEDRRVEVDAGQTGLQRADDVLDAARHLDRVRPRQFLHDQQQPGAVVDDRVTDQRLVGLENVRDVTELDRRRQWRVLVLRLARGWCRRWSAVDGDLGEVGRRDDRRTFCTASRWLGVSTIPPVPITDPRRTEQSGVHRIGGRLHHLVEADVVLRMRPGSTCTVIICRRSFHSATFATPGTEQSGRIVQYAVMDISMSEWSFDVILICNARPVADTGASITGGAAQVGSVALTADIQVATKPCVQQVDVRVEDQLDRRQLRHRLGPQPSSRRR